ncbi:MAG TPA: O-antigen ligase family protein [Steroidobacteraceae bacterium]|nr:O-antigen ligase family protein [Steroidobacteraceae bacterium]
MNVAVITLKVLVVIVLLSSAPLALKRRWRLFLAIPLSVFQCFLPLVEVAGVPVPLAFFGGMMLWPDLIREFKKVVSWKLTAYVLGIAVLYTLSLLWSVNRKLGLQPIGYACQFLIIFAAVITEGRRDQRIIIRLLLITLAFGVLQAIAVVVFRLLPGLKLQFYLSSVSRFFITGNLLDKLLTTAHANTLDPTKSGGLTFPDANDGAAYLGILAFTALGLALYLGKKWLGALCLLFLGATAFTGSKAALIFAVTLPLIALHVISLHYRPFRNRLRMAMVGIVFLGVLAWIVPRAIEAGESSGYRALAKFLSRSDATLASREQIWSYGAVAFLQQPFLGQGFGGWQAGFTRFAYKYGIESDFPPHNTIIYLWSQGTLLATVLGLGFIIGVLRFGWRQMRDTPLEYLGLNLAMTMAFLWAFIYGMGSNIGLIGEAHMSPVLASLLALGYVHRRASAVPENAAGPTARARPLARAAPATIP